MFSNDISNMVRDILTFKGFMSSSFTDKLKWLFVLFPFFLFVVILYMIPFILEIPNMTKRKLRKKK